MAKKPRINRPRLVRRAAIETFSDRELETVVQALVAVRWAIASQLLSPSPLGLDREDKALERLDGLIERMGGPIGTGKYYHQQVREGVDTWTGKRLNPKGMLYREPDKDREKLVRAYVQADLIGDVAGRDLVKRIMEATSTGVPTCAEYNRVRLELKRLAKKEQEAKAEIPAAFHDVIEDLEF